MRRTVSCCHNCPDRILHCHSTCEKYKAEKEEYLKEKADFKKKYNMEREITHAMVENKRRVRKAANVKK